jgi:ABC-type transporter Mla subunit MlaD
MNIQSLKDSLQQLRQHLESGGPIDAELKQLLVTLDQDIHHVIARQEAGEAHEPGLVDRARQVSAQLAADHPVLESAMRQLADTLGKMGI